MITCTTDQVGLVGQLEHLELGQGTNQLKHEENGLHQHLHDFNSSGVPGHDLLIQIQRFSVPSWLPVFWLSGLAHGHRFAMFLVQLWLTFSQQWPNGLVQKSHSTQMRVSPVHSKIFSFLFYKLTECWQHLFTDYTQIWCNVWTGIAPTLPLAISTNILHKQGTYV